MLIRSQDKTKLIDFNGTELYIIGKEIRISKWVDHYVVLGEYSTDEKAIKALDMIQLENDNCLYSDHLYDNSAQVTRPYIFASNRTFQMPQDKEV